MFKDSHLLTYKTHNTKQFILDPSKCNVHLLQSFPHIFSPYYPTRRYAYITTFSLIVVMIYTHTCLLFSSHTSRPSILGSRDSVASIQTTLRAGEPRYCGSIPATHFRYVTWPLSQCKNRRGVKLNIHLHLAPRLSAHIPPLPHTPSGFIFYRNSSTAGKTHKQADL
jgi:hypothetical protein